MISEEKTLRIPLKNTSESKDLDLNNESIDEITNDDKVPPIETTNRSSSRNNHKLSYFKRLNESFFSKSICHDNDQQQQQLQNEPKKNSKLKTQWLKSSLDSHMLSSLTPFNKHNSNSSNTNASKSVDCDTGDDGRNQCLIGSFIIDKEKLSQELMMPTVDKKLTSYKPK
jgi:hypothetical protein